MADPVRLIKDFFEYSKEIVSLHLFGSHAKGLAIEQSDIDIAVLFFPESVPETMELIELREQLSERLNRDVDLICLNTASPIIAMQVLKHGKLILTNDRKQYDRYVIDLFTDYADLKRLRRPMETEILKRKFYG